MLYFFHVAGASALWALAGVTRHQQQRIASMIGINILVDMLMLKSETLQFIAGRAIIALTTENIENQNKIVAGGGVQPLVRLLRSAKTSEKVCQFIDLSLVGKNIKFSVDVLTVWAFSTIPSVGAGRVGNARQSLVKIPCRGRVIRSVCLPSVYSLYGTCGYCPISLPLFCGSEWSVIT